MQVDKRESDGCRSPHDLAAAAPVNREFPDFMPPQDASARRHRNAPPSQRVTESGEAKRPTRPIPVSAAEGITQVFFQPIGQGTVGPKVRPNVLSSKRLSAYSRSGLPFVGERSVVDYFAGIKPKNVRASTKSE